MRIGIDATCLPSALAGAGRYIQGLVTGLTAIDTTHEFIIFIKASDRARFQADHRPNMTFVTIPHNNRPARLLWGLLGAPRIIPQFNLDVWHAPHYFTPLTNGACKVVVTFHDMAFHLFPELYPLIKRHAFRWAIRKASRSAARIIATSHATRNETTQILHVDPDRITVVHHGIDASFRRTDAPHILQEIRRRYGISGPYLLAISTIDYRKNFLTLIRAYHRLIERDRTPCSLVVAGQKGNGYTELTREISSLGLTDRVRLIGYVSEKDLPGLYSGARLFVSPSRYEGFGFTALEALACGTPVLTTPSPSVTEISTRAQIITEPLNVEVWYNRIAAALAQHHNPSAKERPEWMERSSWTDVARRTIRVYEDAAGQADPTPLRSTSHRPAPSRLVPDACTYAALRTITYADLFDYPLTACEVHRNLIGFRASQEQVDIALQSPELSDLIVERDGWFMLKGRERLTLERPQRAAYASALFQRHRRLIHWLCACPFVRMVALSGAIAFENCREQSDIDMFMIVDGRRIWSAYAFLAAVARLLGKRDLLCMNYLIGRADFHIEEHDFYTAHQIAGLRPIYGWSPFRRFTASNGWVMDYLPQWNGHSDIAAPFGKIVLPRRTSWMKKWLEWTFSIPVLNPVEWVIYRVYGRRLIRKAAERTDSDVRLARDRIKLHTNDYSRRIIDRFERRVAEVLKANGRIRRIESLTID